MCVCTYCVCTEKAMAPHSSTLAWKIPWTEEPGRLQSMGSLRVGHHWATSLSLFTFIHWRRKWQPTSSVLAWRIPGMGEPAGLPSMGSHRVGHDWSNLAAAAALCVYVSVSLSIAIELDEVEKIFKIFFHLKYALFSTCESHSESLPIPQRHRI